jgi:hypothetical protein
MPISAADNYDTVTVKGTERRLSQGLTNANADL